MKYKVLAPNSVPAQGPYSQAVVYDKFIFTAGQIYITEDGRLLKGTVEEQMHLIMKNLEAILKAAGATFSDVVKSTIYLTDMAVFTKVNTIYGEYFSEPFPARDTVCVQELPMKAKIEISMIAIKST